jgi:hypothetical protein
MRRRKRRKRETMKEEEKRTQLVLGRENGKRKGVRTRMALELS